MTEPNWRIRNIRQRFLNTIYKEGNQLTQWYLVKADLNETFTHGKLRSSWYVIPEIIESREN